MDIEAVIAQATEQAAPESKATEQDAKTAQPPENKESVTPDNTDDLQNKADDQLTEEQLAKREANRQSHLNSKLAKMRRENRELRERLAAEQKALNQPPNGTKESPSSAPKEDDYDNYGDYLQARAEWAVEQKLAERDKKSLESTKAKEVDSRKSEAVNAIATQSIELAKENPEFQQLMKEHIEYFQSGEFPDHIENAFLAADAPLVAMFALMKEGKLESLEDMDPYRVSMEIGKAEIRGQAYLAQKKVTNAPKPISGSRSTAVASKSLEDKSVDELMKQFNQR